MAGIAAGVGRRTMTLFLLNIVLALLWAFLWGSLDIYTLVSGFILGYLLLGVYSRVTQVQGYGGKVLQLIRFLAYFIRILIKANFQIAREVVTPRHHMKPRILRYDVSGMTEAQLTVLANTISLTPGTLVVDVSQDKQNLYVHFMYAEDRDEAIRQLDELRRRLMTEVFQ
jgi:multicomponent Na+:H+ antiporter subunit E